MRGESLSRGEQEVKALSEALTVEMLKIVFYKDFCP